MILGKYGRWRRWESFRGGFGGGLGKEYAMGVEFLVCVISHVMRVREKYLRSERYIAALRCAVVGISLFRNAYLGLVRK